MTWLDWPECRNVRDIGGTPTVDGAAIKAAALVRSGDLRDLTDDGRAALDAYGITRIVDLRTAWEQDRGPSPFADDPRYRANPVDAGQEHAWPEDENAQPVDLAGAYRLMLQLYAAGFGRAVAAIAEAPAGPVLVHCHAGKDRTGLVTALAMGAAGAATEAIVEDYAATEVDRRGAAIVAAHLARIEDPAELERARIWTTAPASAMRETLRHLDTTYGGAIGYLTGPGGLTPDTIDLLRARLLS